jgi:hypothetical protein
LELFQHGFEVAAFRAPGGEAMAGAGTKDARFEGIRFLAGRAIPYFELAHNPALTVLIRVLQTAVDVALLVELRSHGPPVFLGERDVALELNGDGYGDLAQANLPSQDPCQRPGLALVV